MSGNNNDSDFRGAWGLSENHVSRKIPDRFSWEYDMNHQNRGHALIFNHEFFDDHFLYPNRAGTNVDCDKLKKSLKRLHFQVSVFKDYKLKEINSKIKEFAGKDHSNNDCILIAILSHGDFGYISAKDVQYKLDNVLRPFTANRCPTLAGKPKLFFIQACQGDQLDGGVTLIKQIETDSGGNELSYKILTHPDFLIAYSTVPGFYSWRNPTNGSWFIQSLCDELDKDGRDYNILTLLTFVCQRVAFNFESNTPSNDIKHGQKQIPCVTSMLTRLLQFHDKKYNRKKSQNQRD